MNVRALLWSLLGLYVLGGVSALVDCAKNHPRKRSDVSSVTDAIGLVVQVIILAWIALCLFQ